MKTPQASPAGRFMRRAIREARMNLARPDGGPFGACIVKDGKVLAGAGFRELRISNEKMKTLGRSRIRLVPGILREECFDLFKAWAARPAKKAY